MSFPSVLTLIFVIAKLCAVIDWSWWLVFAPVIIGVTLKILLLIGIAAVQGGGQKMTDEGHSCSYWCDIPEHIKEQRDCFREGRRVMISTEVVDTLLLNHEDVIRVMGNVIKVESILVGELELYFDSDAVEAIQKSLRETFRQYLISLVKEEWPALDKETK